MTEAYSMTAPDVASAAAIGAEDYSGLVTVGANNMDEDHSSYELVAPDGTRYVLTVERIPGPSR